MCKRTVLITVVVIYGGGDDISDAGNTGGMGYMTAMIQHEMPKVIIMITTMTMIRLIQHGDENGTDNNNDGGVQYA